MMLVEVPPLDVAARPCNTNEGIYGRDSDKG
jgi:hypothetical protein